MNRMLQSTWLACLLGAGITASGCTPGSGESGDTGGTPAVETGLPTIPDLTVVDEFSQSSYAAVNILWVIDSGWNQLQDHRDEMPSFYQQLLLHGVPWRVAITTPQTTPVENRGTLLNEHGAVTSLDQMFVQYFGIPDGSENHFRAVVEWTLTERFEEFNEFYFPGGHLAIIAFTDQGEGTPPGFIDQIGFLEFLDEQDVSSSVSISAITVGTESIRSQWEVYTRETGGIVRTSLNAARNLEDVALNALGLTREFRLSEVPAVAPESLIVTYRGNQRRLVLGEDFTFTFPNTVTLTGPAPFAGSQITVSYQRRVEGLSGNEGGGGEQPDDGSGTPQP